MAQAFQYGPYWWWSVDPNPGLLPGDEHGWWTGPWSFWQSNVTVTAHPVQTIGRPMDLHLTVTEVSSHIIFDPDHQGEPWLNRGQHFIEYTIRNVGYDPVTHYRIWVGGVSP